MNAVVSLAARDPRLLWKHALMGCGRCFHLWVAVFPLGEQCFPPDHECSGCGAVGDMIQGLTQ